MGLELDHLRSAVAEVLEIDAEQLLDDVVFEELTDYDSIKVLTLLAALDDFGILLSQDDIANLKTFGDVKKLAHNKVNT